MWESHIKHRNKKKKKTYEAEAFIQTYVLFQYTWVCIWIQLSTGYQLLARQQRHNKELFLTKKRLRYNRRKLNRNEENVYKGVALIRKRLHTRKASVDAEFQWDRLKVKVRAQCFVSEQLRQNS